MKLLSYSYQVNTYDQPGTVLNVLHISPRGYKVSAHEYSHFTDGKTEEQREERSGREMGTTVIEQQ